MNALAVGIAFDAVAALVADAGTVVTGGIGVVHEEGRCALTADAGLALIVRRWFVEDVERGPQDAFVAGEVTAIAHSVIGHAHAAAATAAAVIAQRARIEIEDFGTATGA